MKGTTGLGFGSLTLLAGMRQLFDIQTSTIDHLHPMQMLALLRPIRSAPPTDGRRDLAAGQDIARTQSREAARRRRQLERKAAAHG